MKKINKYKATSLKNPSQKFLSSPITKNFALIFLLLPILALVVITLFYPNLLKSFFGGFGKLSAAVTEYWNNINFMSILFPLLVLLGVIACLFLSFYLMRATYSSDLTREKSKFKKFITKLSYIIGQLYIIILEMLFAGTLFIIGFYIMLPDPSNRTSVLDKLLYPTIVGAIFLIIGYSILNKFAEIVFEKYYGGLWILEELKRNRDGIDAVAHIFFIIALLGSILGLFNFDSYSKDEQALFFSVYIFSIAFYILKVLKNGKITRIENTSN